MGPPCWSARTYRYYGHTVFDNPLTYRTAEEEEAHWRARDPLLSLPGNRTWPPRANVITAEEMDADGRGELTSVDGRRCEAFADASPLPEPHEIYEDVYGDYPVDMMRRGANMPV